jgi:hypothetical protein
MNSLHSQQMWELLRAHQEEMRQAAQREHLARMARQAQVSWWRRFLSRYAQKPTIVLTPSATPN